MNALIRSSFIVATIAAICFALLQVVCRVVFWQLPHLEGTINDILAEQGITVTGLEGRWNGVNPGFFAERVSFPAGEAVGFDFELDLVESLGRNRLVARRMTVSAGRIAFDKTAAGWSLRGSSGNAGIDLRTLFTHSDQVWLRGMVGIYEAGRGTVLHVESMFINEDGNHRFHLGVQTDPECAKCALTVDGDITDDGPGAVRVAAAPLLVTREVIDLAGLTPLFGASTTRRAELDVAGDWRRSADGVEQAQLRVESTLHGLPGAPARMTVELTAWRDDQRDYRGRIESLSLESGEAAFALAGGGFNLRRLDRWVAGLWLPQFTIEDAAAPIAAAFGPNHVVGRRVARFAPRARIDSLGLRIDRRGIAFHGQASQAALDAYGGIPEVANATFDFGGNQYAARFYLDSHDLLLAFPEYLPTYSTFRRGTGTFTFTYLADHIGLRGSDIALTEDEAHAQGAFALARAMDDPDVHIVVDGQVSQVDVDTSREYLPVTLAADLRSWLRDNVRAGELHNVRIVYQGRTTVANDLPLRRFEMTTDFVDTVVTYHPDWPTATGLEGTLTVTGDETRVRGRGNAVDVELPTLSLRIAHKARGRATAPAIAELTLACETTVSRLLDFAWATPIHGALPFLSETWTGAGTVQVNADLRVPLANRPLGSGDVRADFRLDNVSFDLADIGLQFEGIDASVHYEFPADVASDVLRGRLFGAPVSIGISSNADTVRFELTGSATPQDAYRLLDLEDPGIAEGRLDFDATFTVFTASERAMELQVESDLAGLTVTLPPPLAKPPGEPRHLSASMQFLDTHVAVAARYGDADGWLHTTDGAIRAGAIGIGTSVPMIDAASGRVVLAGGLDEIDTRTIAELIAPSAGVDRPFAWELRRFSVDKIALDGLEITEAVLDGFSDGGEVNFSVTAAEMTGTVAKSGDQPWQVRLSELRLAATEDAGDPLSAAVIDRLLAADVDLAKVFLGDEDYGSWKLSLRPEPEGVALTDIVANVRGLQIESTGEVYWSREGETRFAGEVRAGNLIDVLPLWGFAPSVESESFYASGEVRWPGSPLNFDLAHLSGDTELRLANGRFLDVAQGATPILSLVNFSTIAKRMNLDFSDVFGAGVSFEEVVAEMSVDDGLARFTKAGEIVGTGSSFQVAGTVDLDSGALDNEMVVTLPLHSSLPWYAAFLALSNPAGAAAIVVGRQVFKDQIRRLTSGKYTIRGTYDEPEVEFVGVFVNDVEVAPAVGEPARTEHQNAGANDTRSGDPQPGEQVPLEAGEPSANHAPRQPSGSNRTPATP